MSSWAIPYHYDNDIYYNGDKYVGGWLNDKKEGDGVFTLVDKRVIKGKWKNDIGEGKCTVTTPDGKENKFEWVNGELKAVTMLTSIFGQKK